MPYLDDDADCGPLWPLVALIVGVGLPWFIGVTTIGAAIVRTIGL